MNNLNITDLLIVRKKPAALTERELSDAVKLYAECFPADSEGYRDFFFKEYTALCDAFFAFDGGRLIAMLFLPEKTLSYFGEPVKVPYLTAVCVSADYRGRGIAKHIIAAALKFLHECECPLAALYPTNRAVYLSSGFTDVSFIRPAAVKSTGLTETLPAAELTREARILPRTGRAITQLRSVEEWSQKLKEAEIDGGAVYTGRVRGAFEYEIFMDGETDEVLSAFSAYPGSAGTEPFAQARVVNASAAAALFGRAANKTAAFKIILSDPVLPANNGAFLFGQNAGNRLPAEFKAGINTLSALMFGILPGVSPFYPRFITALSPGGKITVRIFDKY